MADVTDFQSFERLEKYWYKRLREKSSFDNVEAVLACNKVDLLEAECDPSHRERFFQRADTFVSSLQMPIINISALRGDNVQILFQQLILNILQNESLVKHLKQYARQVHKPASNPTKSCC
ncbi:unnamed protein product [Didymodactylos carnosus]|nr:unnamed protein product [Didymodactylos carnosus]CAF4318494.1 unnamed protein product [Didymodactylos carnosus]